PRFRCAGCAGCGPGLCRSRTTPCRLVLAGGKFAAPPDARSGIRLPLRCSGRGWSPAAAQGTKAKGKRKKAKHERARHAVPLRLFTFCLSPYSLSLAQPLAHAVADHLAVDGLSFRARLGLFASL